jgi:hypothetical protein
MFSDVSPNHQSCQNISTNRTVMQLLYIPWHTEVNKGTISSWRNPEDVCICATWEVPLTTILLICIFVFHEKDAAYNRCEKEKRCAPEVAKRALGPHAQKKLQQAHLVKWRDQFLNSWDELGYFAASYRRYQRQPFKSVYLSLTTQLTLMAESAAPGVCAVRKGQRNLWRILVLWTIASNYETNWCVQFCGRLLFEA